MVIVWAKVKPTDRPCIGGSALVIAAPPLYRRLCAGHRRTALVSAALRWSSPHRPCIGGSALVTGGASVYRGLGHGHKFGHRIFASKVDE
jgi:hypothetical protein